MVFGRSAIEHEHVSNSLVPMGGKLPFSMELQTGKLLNVFQALDPKMQSKGSRATINKRLASRTRPGLYMILNDHLHLAYADQREGHGSQHYWRLFFDDTLKDLIEQAAKGTALLIGSKQTASNKGSASPGPNAHKEWGGMYFRSENEIKIAEELDRRGILFFANARGRVSSSGSPISGGEFNGRIEVDFLVFRQGQSLILEVDGRHHDENGQALRDYARDRLLLREGIPTARFTAQECFNRPGDVVEEFLNLLENKCDR